MNWEQIVAFLRGLGVTDVPVDLTDPRLTPEKLAEFRDAVKDAYREARSAHKPVAELRQLADAVSAVQAEVDTRAEVAKLDADIDKVGEGEAVETESEVADKTPEGATTDLDPENPILVPDPTLGDGTLTEDDKSSKELAAAATAALAAAGSEQPEGEMGGEPEVEKPAPLVASASFGTVAVGAPLDANSMGRMAEEAVAGFRAGAASWKPGEGERKVRVATALGYSDRPGHDDSKVLSLEKGPTANTKIIRKALAEHTAAVKAGKPMTAATFCPPFDVIREIPDSTDTSTPLRDSLPFVPFSHGGFTFNAGVQFADVTGAVAVWSESDQDAVDANDDSTWKPCYEIVCPTPTTLRADDWITACVQWKVGMDLNNPENIADVFRKVEGNRARVTEQYLLGLLDPLLTNYTYHATPVSASMPDFVAAVVSSFEASGYDARLRGDISYTMYLDTGVLGNLVVDRERSAFGIGREQERVREHLMRVFDEAGLPIDRMVQLKERQPSGTQLGKGWSYGAVKANGNPTSGVTAANQAAVTGPDLLTKFRIRIIPTSEVFAFGTGEIRTGVRQDFAMARQNKVGWFVEEAIKLGKYGVSPWFALNIDLCPSGARTGWVDPADIDCGSDIGS